MAQAYKITAVGSTGENAPKDWQGSYGPMVDYKVKLEGQDGIITLTQKKDTPAPTVGQELYGSIDMSGNYGPKFKKEQRPGQGGGGGRNFQPRDDAAIRAQFAIKAAVQLFGTTDKALTETQKKVIKVNAEYFNSLVEEVKTDNKSSDDGFTTVTTDPGPTDADAPAASEHQLGEEPINVDDIPF